MQSLPCFMLFDLDDTILDFTATGSKCWELLCASFAPRIGSVHPSTLRSAIEQSSCSFWSDPTRHRTGRLNLKEARRKIVLTAFEQLQIDDRQIGEELADTFTVTREEMVRPFAGSLDALREFRNRGIRMALVTNGQADTQRNKIRRFNLEPYFDLILIEGELGIGKPDPRIFRYALERLGASPAEAWMVGDSLEIDLRPAQELGMSTVWVDHAKTGLPANSPVLPTFTVNALAELAIVKCWIDHGAVTARLKRR